MKKRDLLNLRKLFLALLFFSVWGLNLLGQTNPAAQSLPYSQDFSSLTGSSPVYPAGFQGWDIAGSLSTTYPTAAPSADRVITVTTNVLTSRHVGDFIGKMGLMSTGSAMSAICLSITTTGLTGIQVTYDAMTQRTENTRQNEMGLQYRIGTSGTFTDVAGSAYQNQMTPTNTSGTGSVKVSNISVTLPVAAENQAVVQLRWVIRDVSGTGNRPGFAIDNISISGSGGGSTPPTLNADVTNNNVDSNLDITFTDDAAWRSAITAVKVGGTALTLTTDYVISSGTIQLIPSGGNSLLTTAGSKSVTVEATGYTVASVTQQINAGAPTTNSTATINLALLPNTTRTITCTAKDQYNNLVSGYTFKYDVAITDNDATTNESFLIDGTGRTSSASDINVVATTNGSGVATFSAAVPSVVDPNDGISIQVQLSDGTTNIGSAFSFTQVPPQITLTGIDPGSANLPVSSTYNVIYRIKVDVVNNSADLTGLNAQTGGTYVSTDITSGGFNLYYSDDATFNSGTDTYLDNVSSITGNGEVLAFGSFTRTFPIGTAYLFITANVSGTANIGNTVTCSVSANENFTFTGSPSYSGSTFAAANTHTIISAPIVLAAWDFFGQSSPATFAATTFNAGLVNAANSSDITRGSGAASSSASNSFRTQGFQNNGIATSNTDYFQITLQAESGKTVSLSTIDANFAGTASFCVSPGVSNQFAYSLDGSNFTLIGSPQILIGTPAALSQIDLTGISALQNVPNGTTITLRYYASGQTTTGGWGFYSASSGTNGLAIGGTVCTCGQWTGAADENWSNTANWSCTTLPTSSTNVSIGSGNLHVTAASGTPSVCNDLSISLGANLFIDAAKALTVSGNTINNGTITIKSDATGTGSFLDNGSIGGTGTFNVEQYLTGANTAGSPSGRYWYLGSPVETAKSSVFDAAGSNRLWLWDEPSNGYSEISDNTSDLDAKTGYVVRLATNTTVNFTGGKFNTGTADINTISRTGTTNVKRGFALIANPYPSYIDWDAATKSNLKTTIWYRTVNLGNTMVFDTYNTNGGLGSNNNGNGDVTGIIAPMQAIWVRVDYDGNTGSVSFSNAIRSHGTSKILKKSSDNSVLRIKLDNGSNSDEALIYFNALADNASDDFDSPKMFNTIGDFPHIYSMVGNDTLAINGFADIFSNPVVSLGIKVPAGSYSITASEISGFDISQPIYLKDNLLNIIQNLNANPNYSFTSSAVNSYGRFEILFDISTSTLSSNAASEIQITAFNGNISVTIPNYIDVPCEFELFDLLGQKLMSKKINNGTNQISANFATGCYYVKILSGTDFVTKKIFIER